jgi:hypothetical protein|tara:strand:- start:23 stop:358 length:336 start_codon:yes stop_codon:yes gene_type:complete
MAEHTPRITAHHDTDEDTIAELQAQTDQMLNQFEKLWLGGKGDVYGLLTALYTGLLRVSQRIDRLEWAAYGAKFTEQSQAALNEALYAKWADGEARTDEEEMEAHGNAYSG